MQTFLPYPNFTKTARVLDDKRLFKQLVEAQQLIALITHGKTKSGKPFRGWQYHPARKMWDGHANALKKYANTILDEVQRRKKVKTKLKHYYIRGRIRYPEWLGNKKFHSSHRAALLAKNFNHYQQFNWSEKPHINYIWPLSKYSFKIRVLQVVKKIPRGKTLTYKQVAQLANNPKAYRAVGNILNKNHDPKIPCHRVIRSNGQPGGYNRGEKKKIQILKQEKAI